VLTPKYQTRNWSSIQKENTEEWRLNDITPSTVGTGNLLISHMAEDKNIIVLEQVIKLRK